MGGWRERRRERGGWRERRRVAREFVVEMCEYWKNLHSLLLIILENVHWLSRGGWALLLTITASLKKGCLAVITTRSKVGLEFWEKSVVVVG